MSYNILLYDNVMWEMCKASFEVFDGVSIVSSVFEHEYALF